MPASRLGVLRHRNLSAYVASRFLSTLATQIQSVAIGWQVYDITGSVVDLGFVGLAQFLPFLLLILPAGQAADRFDRRRIINVCMAVNLLCTLGLLAFTLSGVRVVWPVFAMLVLFGAARAFSMPAAQAIVINLVPREQFGQAVAINSSAMHISTIAGPMLGGLLYLAGPREAYAVAAALFATSTLLLLAVKTAIRPGGKPAGGIKAVFEGLSFVFSRPVMLGAISLDLFAVLFGGATALLPAMAKDVLHMDASSLGLLRSAPAIGGALTTLCLAARPIQRHVGSYMFGGVAVFGLATIGFGLSTSLWLSVLALAVMGCGDMVSVYIRHILVQSETPDEIRGRVSAVSAVFIGASNELGEFESGIAARLMGIVPAVVFGGFATLAVTGGWMAMFRSLRTMDRFPDATVASKSDRAVAAEQAGDERNEDRATA